jgi:threonine synthase
VACVSTGNTSASMTAYAAAADLQPIIFIPHGNIAFGKLAQALEYGANGREKWRPLLPNPSRLSR